MTFQGCRAKKFTRIALKQKESAGGVGEGVCILACVCRAADVFTRGHACARVLFLGPAAILCHTGNMWLGSGTVSHIVLVNMKPLTMSLWPAFISYVA